MRFDEIVIKQTNAKSNTHCGVSPINNDRYRTHAWRVSLRRRGRVYVKNFADKKCGGKQQALAPAKTYRDTLIRLHPPLSRQEFCVLLRSNNKTGIAGVCRYAKSYTRRNGDIVYSWYWEATWPIGKSRQPHQAFSVNEHGEARAWQLAIRTRKQALKALDGVYWASARGR